MTPATKQHAYCEELFDQLLGVLGMERDAARERAEGLAGVPLAAAQAEGAASGLEVAVTETAAIRQVLLGAAAEPAALTATRRQRAVAVLGVAVRAVRDAACYLEDDRDLAVAVRRLGLNAAAIRGQVQRAHQPPGGGRR